MYQPLVYQVRLSEFSDSLPKKKVLNYFLFYSFPSIIAQNKKIFY